MVASPLKFRILIESFLVFPTPSIFYDLLGGLDSALTSGVVDGIALPLAGGVGAGGGG